jgi:hypothetical protein
METACGRIALELIIVLSRPEDQFLRCAPAAKAERASVFGNMQHTGGGGGASKKDARKLESLDSLKSLLFL